ncbi:MAG: DUF885 domain-containing protein [Pseudomonadales bacterium]
MRYLTRISLALLLTQFLLGCQSSVKPQASRSESQAAVSASSDWNTRVEQETSIDALGQLYLALLLEEDPTSGINYGIHGKGDNPRYYDDRLPDVSAAAWEQAEEAREFFLQRLAKIEKDSLSRAEQVDLHILQNKIELELMQLTRLGYSSDPLTYVSLLGGAMSGLILRDYAPLQQRLQSFAARCGAVGKFLDETKEALSSPDVHPTAVQKKVAVTRLRGMIQANGLFDKSLPELIATAKLTGEQAKPLRLACADAVAKISAFADWFEATVVPRSDSDWRLGRELYEAKYKLYMDYPLAPDELLAAAEAELARVGGDLVSTARRIHDEYLAEGVANGEVQKAESLDDGQVVRDVFQSLAEDRSTADTLIADSYALADAITGFVRDKDLLELPPTSKLRIEDIPPHLSGYAVAQIIPAPPFEPQLESVWFWDLALLATSDSYLKEYNRTALALVYIHEGVPGHFVQLEYSNRFDRTIPKVFLNGPMVEGWASYIATQLVDEGFTIYPDQPFGHELQEMADDKLVLRSLINAIIDIRLHTSDWSEEDAVKLMTSKGFQEEGEAQGKLTRAKLSSVQLASYFAGHRAILELLKEYKSIKGEQFSYKDFNQRLVSAGSPPFFALKELMLAPQEN